MIPTLIAIVVVMTVPLLALAHILKEAADHERPRMDE